MRCRIHCPQPDSGSGLLYAVVTGGAVLAVTLFIVANLVLVSVTAGVLAVAGVAYMRVLHRRVIVHHPALTPFFASQLRAQGLKPIPGTVRVALPAAETVAWRVVSVEKVPDAQAVQRGS